VQNRYVGDIGDYVKLAILRTLCQGGQRRLGVAWWLFPDEHHKPDGRHRECLERPEEWKQFDPCLFKALLRIEKEKTRNVRALEDAALLPNAVFAGGPIPCGGPFKLRPLKRADWLERIKTQLKDCDLVFLDPDNGIEPEGLRLTLRRAGKSVTLEEIRSLSQNHRTIVIYHHQTRRKGGHQSELRDLATRLRKSRFRVSGALRAKPWSPRAFFILNGGDELDSCAKKIAGTWKGHISWHPEDELM